MGRFAKRIGCLTGLLLGGLWPGAAAAYRPFDGTDAAIAEPGEVETELGLGRLTVLRSNTLIVPQVVLNLGLSRRWEIVFEGVGLVPLDSRASPAFRFEDTGLFMKGIVREGSLQGSTGPSVATEVGAHLPTLNGPSGGGAGLAIIASQRWSALTLHLNAQAGLTRAKNLGWFGGLIAEGPGCWPLRPVGEVFVEDEGGGNSLTISGLLGMVWPVSEGIFLDMAFRAARQGDIATYEARLGFTWDLRLWDKA